MATQIPNVELDITEEQVRSNVENFRQSNPVSRGTMSAPNIENSQRFNITDAPRQEAADKVISSTFIQPEIEAQPMQQKEDVSPEANELRKQIAERQDVLDELGLGGIKDSFEQLMQKGAFTSEAEDAAGIGDKTTSLNEIQSQLRETDLRFRRDREALEDEVGLTKAQKNQSLATLSRTQARELADLSVIQATRRDDLATAQALVDRKVELTFEPIKQKLQFQEMMYQENKALFNQAEQRQFETKLRKEEQAMEKDMFKFKQLENTKVDIMDRMAKAGASNAQLNEVLRQDTIEGIYSSTAGLLADTAVLDSGELIKNIEITGVPTTDVANVINATGAKKSQSMTDAVNVIASVQGFADRNKDGEFVGLSPIRMPGFLMGDEARTEKQSNIGDIEAINLKVQQWASGAALTDDQTEQVKRLAPDKNDTDRQVKNKVNQLTNFMLKQVQGELASQGINYQPKEVDFFNQDPLDLGTPVGENDPLGIN